MQVVYQRCAAIDVGKDVIAVAVRLPGDGPDGRQTIKRTFKTLYGVLAEVAGWLTGLGVTHVAMEATGIYSMPVYHALVEHGDFEKVLVCNAGHVKNVPGRKTDPTPSGWCTCWSAGCWPAASFPRPIHSPGRDQGGPGRDPLQDGSGREVADRWSAALSVAAVAAPVAFIDGITGKDLSLPMLAILADVDDPRATTILCAHVDDENWLSRYNAGASLRRRNDAASRPCIEHALGDADV